MEELFASILKIALLVIAAIMTFFILLQEGKGGGLSALGGTKAASVEGVTNPIRRATAYLAVLFFLLAIVLGRLSKGAGSFTQDNPFKDQETGAKAGEPKPGESGGALPLDMPGGAPGFNPEAVAPPVAPPAGVEVTVPIPPKSGEKTEAKSVEEPGAKTPGNLETKSDTKLETKTGPGAELKSGQPADEKSGAKTESKTAAPMPPGEGNKSNAPPAAAPH